MSVNLSTAYLERDAIRAPNYFNGRVLSAEDMLAERAARERTLAQLGRATGTGIAYGLEVTGDVGGSTVTVPVVRVSAGLAINRLGEPIELGEAVEVSLLEPPSNPSNPAPAASKNGFQNCTALATSVYAAGQGVYLLTIAPAEAREGRATVSGLGNLTACCGDKSIVEGVQFRLIRLDVSASDLVDQRLRNRLAHRCFGTTEVALAGFPANPFGVPLESYGLVDSLRKGHLRDAELPLALIHWTASQGTRFIDQWAVRRRIIRPSIADRWQPALGDRRAAEHEAMFQQFQAQVEVATWSVGAPEAVRAIDHFDLLPPAGVLPLGGVPGHPGFVDGQFFATLKIRNQPLYIEGARLPALLRASFGFPPIPVGNGELIWTYVVRENQQAAGGTVAPYLVFTSGHMPNFADPHFDVAKWKFANYYLKFGDLL